MAFEFHLPDLAEGMTEAEVVAWKVAVGDKVALDQPVVEVMSDKATVEIPSPRAGTIAKLNFNAGDICPVGQVLFVIEEEGGKTTVVKAAGSGATAAPKVSAPKAAAAGASRRPEVIDATADRKRVLATPATRRLARTLGVDIAHVPGTGKYGRVTRVDVEGFGNGQSGATIAQPAVAARPAQTPISIARGGEEERIPLRGVRKRIAENMARSASTAAHFTYVEEVDTTDLVAVRDRAKARAAERGLKLTYLPFIIKAVVAGLKKWPALNASLDESTQEIVRKRYYNIGVAAQGPAGLTVTSVRDCDQRSIFEIAAEIDRLAEAVRNGTATRDELTGTTFTISSLGKLGGLMATPIINFPEVGILGVHKMEQRAVVVDGQIVARWRMNLSVSLDHRIVDGWDGAMFLQDVKALLEDPTMMFMEMV